MNTYINYPTKYGAQALFIEKHIFPQAKLTRSK